MLRPSYSELMEVLNNESDLNSEINSRYIIVIAAAKRARQIIDGSEPMVALSVDKAVSIAVKEMAENKLIVTKMEHKEAEQKEEKEEEQEEEFVELEVVEEIELALEDEELE